MAIAAFLLLAKSLQVQHQELRESSDALREAGRAQTEQVRQQKAAATMNAYSTLISSVDQKIASQVHQVQAYEAALSAGDPAYIGGKPIPNREIGVEAERIRQSLEELEQLRVRHIEKLGQALSVLADGDEAINEIVSAEGHLDH